MKQLLTRWVQRITASEPIVLIVLLLITLGVWGFVEVADEVTEGETESFDCWMVQALRKPDQPTEPIGPTWMHEVGRDLTALGGVATVTLLTGATAGFLWIDRRRNMALLLVVATVGGVVMSLLLKSLFARPRPDVVPHLSIVHTSSFPSGHSMMSAVVYLTLGTLLAASVESRLLRIYALSVAVLLTLLVGASRVYMGVHYPTDVLAGWAAGLVWALLCWLIARRLQHHGNIEPPDTEHVK